MIIAIILILILTGMVFIYGSLSYAWFRGAPTVYADRQAIRDCLKLARLAPGETLLDLGCGDARSLIIAAGEFGARGVGVDASLYCCLLAHYRVWRSGQAGKIKIVWRSVETANDQMKQADVIYLYLYPDLIAKLKPELSSARAKKTRLVLLSFPLAGQRPQQVRSTFNLGRPTKIYLY